MEIYCMKCKKATDTLHEEYVEVDSTRGMRGMVKKICTICSKKKSKFVKLRSVPIPVGEGSLSQGRRIGRGTSEIISEIKSEINKLKKKVKSSALTDIEINNYVKELDIKNFRGVFARDELTKPLDNECLICNTGESDLAIFHWVALKKEGSRCFYFDSFGAPPMPEVISYFGDIPSFQTFQLQKFNQKDCGRRCLIFLKLMELTDFGRTMELLI